MPRIFLSVLISALLTNSGHAQTSAAAEKELTDLEHRSLDATLKKDRSALERIYADDYYCVHSNGAVMNKAQELASNTSTDVSWTEYKLDDVKVRVFGDVGILTARLDLKGRAKGFKRGARRFTDIFVRRGVEWQIVGCQSTIVPTR